MIPWLSPEEAAGLYCALIQDTTVIASQVAGATTHIAFTPADAQPVLRELIDDETIQWFLQQGDDLGDCLKRAFQKIFHEGWKRAVIIGSDSPLLPPGYIEQAFDALNSVDVVLGPATDGGYYLIGLTRSARVLSCYHHIFDHITWGTEKVYEQTVQAVRQYALSQSDLNTWGDVDQKADLIRIAGEIQILREQGEKILGSNTEQILKALQTKLKLVIE
jgi:rSAM/selenodomain-associated transferase 1